MSGIRRQQTLPSALAATISTLAATFSALTTLPSPLTATISPRRPCFWPNQEAFLLADSDCEQPNVLRPSSVPVLSCVCPGKRLAEMIATRHKTIWLLTVAIPLFMTRAEPSQTIRRQCRTHTKLPESNNTKRGSSIVSRTRKRTSQCAPRTNAMAGHHPKRRPVARQKKARQPKG